MSMENVTARSWLTQLRLAGTAALMRTAATLIAGAPKSSPDEVIQVPSRDTGRTIKAHVYTPKEVATPAPVLINYHGSGYILYGHGTDDEFCRRMSSETGHIVLDCRYRLAPENPFPAAVEDVEDLVNWVLSQPEKYDVSRLSISGFSAGGTLALVACGVLFPKDTFKSAITFYPSPDRSVPISQKISGPDETIKPMLPPWVLGVFMECYLPPGTDTRDPRISPINADMDKFPKDVVVITAAGDNLCQEAESFAEKLKKNGGDRNVVARRMEGCNHAFDKNAKPGSVEEKATVETYDLAVETLLRISKA